MANEERDRSKGEPDLAAYQVYDRHYEKIGKVDDLFADENDRPRYVGVKMGFLGTRTTLIPIEIARVNDKRQLVEVEADKETVKEGPTFGDDEELTPEFERRVYDYYRVESREASMADAFYPSTGSERTDLQPGERSRTHGHPEAEPPGVAEYGADRERVRNHADELRVQRSEEELRADTREREAGAKRIRKRVRTEREQVRVPKRREEASIERVPVEEVREASEAEIGDADIVIPVIEEEIVVEKRPVVKEEIRVHKEVVEEEEIVEADVRKEEVYIDDETEREQGPGGDAERTTDLDERTGRPRR